jgi:putative membrane protein
MLSNSLDSAASVQAAATATNAEVKAFAELMVREHGQANVSALETVRRIDTTPPAAGGDAAGRMRAESDSGLAALAQKTGAEFDRAYIDSEVRLHQEALQRLDSEIPNVQNVDLKRLLEQARTMVSAHLERARQIQSSLSQ